MRVLSQPNRCALLESARVPGHLVIFDRHGKITNESSAGYADHSKEFVVFVKVNWREVIKADTAKLFFLLPSCGKLLNEVTMEKSDLFPLGALMPVVISSTQNVVLGMAALAKLK